MYKYNKKIYILSIFIHKIVQKPYKPSMIDLIGSKIKNSGGWNEALHIL